MKSGVLKDKMLSVEEGLPVHQNYNEDSCCNRAVENFNWTRCIQFTKLTFYLIIITYIGWFSITLFVAEYSHPACDGNKDATHELMMNNRNGDNTVVNSNTIPTENIAHSKIEDDTTITSTVKNQILTKSFIVHKKHEKPFSHKIKPDSSNGNMNSIEDVQVSTLPTVEIEKSSSEKSNNITGDILKSDSSEEETTSNDDFGMAISLLEELEKFINENPANDEEDTEKFDSSEEEIISNDDSEKTPLSFGQFEATSSGQSINADENSQKFDLSNEKIISNKDFEMFTIKPDLGQEKVFSQLFWFPQDDSVDNIILDNVSNSDEEANDDKNENFDYADEIFDYGDESDKFQDCFDELCQDDDSKSSSSDMSGADIKPEHSARERDENIEDIIDVLLTPATIFFPNSDKWYDDDYYDM